MEQNLSVAVKFKSKKKYDRSKMLFLCVILAIPISNFLIFWLYVNFNSILMAFQYTKGKDVLWGFYNFSLLWKDITSPGSEFFAALKNTMLFFFSNLCISLPISLLLCYFFYKKIAGFRFFRFVFYLPSIISATVYVVLFKYLIATNGLLGRICEGMGIELQSLLRREQTALWTILFYTIMTSFGGNIILLGGAMNHIDEGIIEAAKIDGCGMWTEFFKIVIPLVWPTLSTLIIFAFVGMFSASGPLLLFLGEQASGVGANTLSFWIYGQVYYSGEYYYPAAIGLILTVVGMPIALGVKSLLNKISDVVEM